MLTTFATAFGLASLALAAPASSIHARADAKFAYGAEKVRGVNLGGWFVLEPWITPSLFDALDIAAVDEWTYTATLGKDEARTRLSNHWNTFITQSDFSAIAAAGMNHVRIPIGYWSITPNDGEPYVQGAYEKLGEALNWASEAGLKVIIDLHGAPGSQNGFDNSGHYGAINWGQGDSVIQTIDAIVKIRNDYSNHPAVSTIELLNEPMGGSINMETIKQFYKDGWGNLWDSPVAIAFSDAFQGVTSWNDWGAGLDRLILDTHHYEIFDNAVLKLNAGEHIATACSFGAQMRASNKWTISGEWTGAMTDCARYLNGYGRGARYDGTFAGSSYVGSCDGKSTGSVSQLSQPERDDMRKYIEAQLDAYESKEGWVFWTWKTEGAPGWDMGDMLANGVFPSPVTSRNFPGQCGY
ncbi:glycoside hydrolase [Tothia fuscella]|uniref:glucan 1,3-beta-glucosidase n=1 Tax=Tothia fuscella TaxID=1048955 RepID=A0A9P4NF27_9PEZI|nr:glycoside hydrolase [Tothia fuscella]